MVSERSNVLVRLQLTGLRSVVEQHYQPIKPIIQIPCYNERSHSPSDAAEHRE